MHRAHAVSAEVEVKSYRVTTRAEQGLEPYPLHASDLFMNYGRALTFARDVERMRTNADGKKCVLCCVIVPKGVLR